MSYGLRVYVLDAPTILQVPGSRDEALLAEIIEQCAGGIADFDEDYGIEMEDACPGFSFSTALREIFEGEYTQPEELGFVYGWAFDLICSHLGQWAHRFCDRWSTKWLLRLDETMATGAIGLRFFGENGLIERCPVHLPDNQSGIPGIGHWTHAKIMAALEPLKALMRQVEDEHLREALDCEIHSWLLAAAEQPGSMLVGIYG